MPCGCKKDMSKVEGFSKMRFVGKPGGKLMKGAPGNFKHGEIYVQPFHLSSFPFWELVEPKPELNIPEASKSDSVFEDAVFVPDNDAAPVEMNTPPTEVAGVNVDPNAPAILEPYMRLNLKTGKLIAVPDEPKLEPKPEPILEPASSLELDSKSEETKIDIEVIPPPVPETLEVTINKEETGEEDNSLNRDELMKILNEKGIKYSLKARTSTLKKMVDELAPKE